MVLTPQPQPEGHGGPGGKCGAKKRQGPGTCGQAAGWGTDHPGIGRCRLHGGSTSTQKAHVADQRVEREVRLLLSTETLEPVNDPIYQLQMIAAEALALKTVLLQKVEELTSLTYEDLVEKEDVRALLLAYERALDRCEKFLSGMARLDIDARMVRVNEARAALLIRVVEAVLDSRELGLDRDQRTLGRTILAQELTRVTVAA